MIRLILLISIVSINLFVLLNTFVYSTLSINLDNLYSGTMVAIAIVIYIYFIFRTLQIREITRSTLILIVIIFIVVIFGFSNIREESVRSTFIYFFIWGVPAALSGIMLSKLDKNILYRFFNIYFIFSSLIFIILVIYYGYSSFTTSLTLLTNHQQISYLSAISFGLGIYFYNSNKSLSVRCIYIIFILNNLMVCFASGGRGGVVLLIVYISLFIFKNLISLKFLNSFLLIAAVSLALFLNSENIINDRTFSYISDDGISLSGSSGRDVVYGTALDYIVEKPILGYGLFGYYDLFHGTPHNIFLEVLLISGIIGLLIFIILCAYFIMTIWKKLKNESVDYLVVFIFLYPAVMLLFSGNFLIVSELWFMVFYILSVRSGVINEKVHYR